MAGIYLHIPFCCLRDFRCGGEFKPRRKYNGYVIVALSILLMGCRPAIAPSPDMNSSSAVFDFKAYMQGEIKRLDTLHFRVMKRVFWNKQEEQYIMPSDSINWEKELGWFLNIDLSLPSYIGRYAVDTMRNDSSGLEVHYLPDWNRFPRSPELHSAAFFRNADGSSGVIAMFARSSMFSRQHATLFYKSDWGYQIEGDNYMEYVDRTQPFSLNVRFNYP